MDIQSIKCVINSISRFIHLVSCQTTKMPAQQSYRIMASSLKLLKRVLDDVVDYNILPDVVLCKEYEELDIAVNEAREFMERWSPKMSKIGSVSTFWIDPKKGSDSEYKRRNIERKKEKERGREREKHERDKHFSVVYTCMLVLLSSRSLVFILYCKRLNNFSGNCD